jgi:WD40 repeat protein
MGTNIDAVAFSPDSRRVLSAEQTVLRLFDLEKRREERRFAAPSHGTESVDFSPDGRRIVSSGRDRTLRLWETATGRELSRLEGHTDYVHKAMFLSDGRRVLSASGDTTIRLWDAATGQIIRMVRRQKAWLGAGLAVSSDGRRAAITGALHAPLLWDLDSSAEPRLLEEHAQDLEFRAIAFVRYDTVVLAVGGNDGAVHAWDVATGRALPLFCDSRQQISFLTSSPDGRRVLTGSRTGIVSLWDAETSRLLHQFEGHTSQVLCIAFSPDGRYGASGSTDGTLRVWQLPAP